MTGLHDANFIAVDWGTSSLRLWLMAPSGEILAETRSGEGMGGLQPSDFAGVLTRRIADLGPAAGGTRRVLLCGMVGARQGWREAPYVDIPASLLSVAEAAVSVPAGNLDIRILPGMARRKADRPDVMRGEETQLLGLILHDPKRSGLVCMPGTHCKWVTLEAGRVSDFSTAMTGELFAVLSTHSILRHAIGEARPSGDPSSAAFRAGLDAGLTSPELVTARLFALRADSLLFGTDGTASADRLSGLLIGSEVGAILARLDAATKQAITLVASGKLTRLYEAAIRAAGGRVDIVDADETVRAGLLHAARHIWAFEPEGLSQ